MSSLKYEHEVHIRCWAAQCVGLRALRGGAVPAVCTLEYCPADRPTARERCSIFCTWKVEPNDRLELTGLICCIVYLFRLSRVRDHQSVRWKLRPLTGFSVAARRAVCFFAKLHVVFCRTTVVVVVSLRRVSKIVLCASLIAMSGSVPRLIIYCCWWLY